MGASYEQKSRRGGVECPINCIFQNFPKGLSEYNAMHYHEYIEILYGIDGYCNVDVNGKTYRLNPGDLIIINSSEEHAITTGDTDNVHIVIQVLPQIIYTGEQSAYEMRYLMPFIIRDFKKKKLISSEEMKDSFVHDTITNIMREWDNMNYGYEIAMRSDVLKIFLWVLRFWHSLGIIDTDAFEYSDDTVRLVQVALEYVWSNYADITEQEVARHCNLSYSYFSRIFKRIMNQSFTSYLMGYRISRAEQMLLTTDKSISEIGELVGFSTPSYFIQQFKKYKGVSPMRFKNSLKSGSGANSI